MAVPRIEGAIDPSQVRREGDRSSGWRLVLILLAVAGAMAWGGYWYATRFSPASMDLILADQPAAVDVPGQSQQSVRKLADLVPGARVVTGASSRTALRFGSSTTLRLAPGTVLRILRCGPLASSGIEVGLEKGRLWLERDASWVPVTVRAANYLLQPGVGSTEVEVGPGTVRVLGWTATVWIRDRQGRDVHQVDLNRGGMLAGQTWRPMYLPERVDPWTAWNMHTSANDLLSGEVMDLAVAFRLKRPPEFVFEVPPAVPLQSSPGLPPSSPEAPPEAVVAAAPGVPGLPGPGYPRGVLRPGAGSVEESPAENSEEPGTGESPDPDVEASPVAEAPRWEPPDSLTTRGRATPPSGAIDVTAPMKIVERQSQADEIAKSVQSLLEKKFRMTLEAPFRLVAAGKEDRTVRIERNVAVIMALEKGEDGEWVGRIASNLRADEFASFGAALYARAWLQERGVRSGLESKGFQRWIAFKYALAVGNKNEARSIPAQGGETSVWLDQEIDRGFHLLWDLEEEEGERGVFRKVLAPVKRKPPQA